MELRKQVCARLHPGRDALLDMLQECRHSLHWNLAYLQQTGSASHVLLVVLQRDTEVLQSGLFKLTSCPGSCSVI